MYWIDKRAAKRGAQRTAENTLHLFERCCGWPSRFSGIKCGRAAISSCSGWWFWQMWALWVGC
ncbi:DUF1294 domain-containing protein [Marinobacter sp. ELB17]|uniref:DUF1294 domain-containing protein n=1 Tax=Marinobacter sp. ELB17 TaxID=270374 RepID=UPI002227E9E3|nr:DUF1294 domain-containing protein [Marinobacter sp. ELB17]